MSDKKKFKDTKFGKILGAGLSLLGGKTPVGIIGQTISGILKGGAHVTFITSLKDLLDVDGDGKITIKDFKSLKWETIMKLATIGVMIYLAIHFKILNLG